MPRETHAPGPKTHATPLQRYISTLLTCKVTLGTQPQRDTPPTDLRLPAPDALLRIGPVLDGNLTGETFVWPLSRSGTLLFPPNRFPEHPQARSGAAQHVMYLGPGLPTSQELGSMWSFLQKTRGLEQ